MTHAIAVGLVMFLHYKPVVISNVFVNLSVGELVGEEKARLLLVVGGFQKHPRRLKRWVANVKYLYSLKTV